VSPGCVINKSLSLTETEQPLYGFDPVGPESAIRPVPVINTLVIAVVFSIDSALIAVVAVVAVVATPDAVA